jgi:hypothetical protein
LRAPGVRVADFIADFDWALEEFYYTRGRSFERFLRGAPAYFHARLIQTSRERGGYPSRWLPRDEAVLELLYAVLAAWGMDSRGARLVDFENFCACVRALVSSSSFQDLEGVSIRAINGGWSDTLSALWSELRGRCKIMVGPAIIVGSSKLLHHLLPDLFPPIDTSYTLDFLRALDRTEQYRLSSREVQAPDFETFFKIMLFFGHVAREVPSIEAYVGKWPVASGSIPKVIDNAVIAWWATDWPPDQCSSEGASTEVSTGNVKLGRTRGHGRRPQ